MAERLSIEEYKQQQLVARNNFYIDLLIEALNRASGKNWQEPWLRSYKNSEPQSITGHKYQGSNAFFLGMVQMVNNYDLPVYLTRDHAKKVGAKIKEGEKPLMITTVSRVYFNQDKEKAKELGLPSKLYEKKYEELPQEQKELYFPKSNIYGWAVFNVGQTNLKEVNPELYAKMEAHFLKEKERDNSVGIRIDAFDQMIKDQSWLCPIREKEVDRAYFHNEKGNYYISVPPKDGMVSDEEYYSTLTHEMAHSTQIKQDKDGKPIREVHYRVMPGRAREELVAELTAGITLCELGINPILSQSNAEYLSNWFEGLGAVAVTVQEANPEFQKRYSELDLVVEFPPLKAVLADLGEPGVSIPEALRNHDLSVKDMSPQQMAILEFQEKERIAPEITVKKHRRITREGLDNSEERDFIGKVVMDAMQAKDIILREGLKLDLSKQRAEGVVFLQENKEEQAKKREAGQKQQSSTKKRTYTRKK